MLMAGGFFCIVLGITSSCGGADVSRSLGARCDSNSECDERCQDGNDYPGGFCTLSCDVTRDCPAGALCTDRDNGICLFGCRPSEAGSEIDECRFLGVGWRCETQPGREAGSEVSVCLGDL